MKTYNTQGSTCLGSFLLVNSKCNEVAIYFTNKNLLNANTWYGWAWCFSKYLKTNENVNTSNQFIAKLNRRPPSTDCKAEASETISYPSLIRWGFLACITINANVRFITASVIKCKIRSLSLIQFYRRPWYILMDAMSHSRHSKEKSI